MKWHKVSVSTLTQCAGEPPFLVLATCIVFLDHVQNLQIHAMRAKFQIVFFTQDLRSECPASARPEAGTLGISTFDF